MGSSSLTRDRTQTPALGVLSLSHCVYFYINFRCTELKKPNVSISFVMEDNSTLLSPTISALPHPPPPEAITFTSSSLSWLTFVFLNNVPGLLLLGFSALGAS